jgi:eukaryotic-like serine/threonine-protein kinase
VRALAYMQMKGADKAMVEFQKILSNPGWRPTSELRTLAQLEVARALALKGEEKEKARAAYQDFLEIWKDANGDLEVLAEAKREMGK